MDKTCNTCDHRNAHGICTNAQSVYFGSRVDDGTCPVFACNKTELLNIDFEFC